MPLTFNQALTAYGIDPRDVRLLRHQTRGVNGRTPYALWRDDRPLFEAYQAAQQKAFPRAARRDDMGQFRSDPRRAYPTGRSLRSAGA